MVQQHIAVPAFFGLRSTFDEGDNWNAVVQAGEAVSLVVGDDYLIWSDRDNTYMDPSSGTVKDVRAQFIQCRGAGQKVLGYVSTQNGKRHLTAGEGEKRSVFADIEHWYSLYGSDDNGQPLLSGIFFDEGPTLRNLPDGLSEDDQKLYYRNLVSCVQAQHPGQNNVLLNAAGFPNEWVVNDEKLKKDNVYVIIWEAGIELYNQDENFQGELPNGKVTVETPPWWTSGDYTNRLVHVVVNCVKYNQMVDCMPPTEETVVDEAIKKSKDRKAGHVYVYDGNPGCATTDKAGNPQTCPDPRPDPQHPDPQDPQHIHKNGGYWRLTSLWIWEKLIKEVTGTTSLTGKDRLKK